ncbi:hypothetical protein [Paenibacillus popilliae]|uniref:hypothetical protein n=1 Tax=Paenibacillus popilliae TaxID=78057 RepID=UPI0011573C74|nr:hypothetical protein [Paenibacillus sp. SDF0028]
MKVTLSSYEQSLRLFIVYLNREHGVDKLADVRKGHIRQYISYVQERGKYTVVTRLRCFQNGSSSFSESGFVNS